MPIAAALQMTSTAVLQQNLDVAHSLLSQARQRGATLAVLPENFAFMGHKERDKFAIAETQGDQGPIQSMLSGAARELSMWVIGGTVPLRVPGDTRVAPASLVFDDRGECVARYDKIHLFDVDVPGGERHRESSSMTPGSTPVMVKTPLGNVGLSVCYDMRFPELYRSYASKHADVLSIPAAFTVPTGRAHWELLLRTRAVENLCYVVAAAQVGQHENGRETFGHSLIVGPWGEVLECLPAGIGVVTAEIDLTSEQEIRTRFPALTHRRLSL
jgi:predicted amidohydrolase